ncbi:MAG TPA: DUF167 domain-containing protein [Candidatus Aenigmarchaeota archaeon]|nr:DUF167 domain-containing protein [Candidatus Aenigmarchaeota archaeon]
MKEVIKVVVKPNASKFAIKKKDNYYIVSVKSVAENGKANMELIRELRKFFGRRVRIIRGVKSRKKIIEIS